MRYEYEVQGRYSRGFEMLCTETTKREALQRLKEYRENETVPFRMVRRVLPSAYSVTVSNVGTVYSGASLRDAGRAFRESRDSCANPGGRDGWESVTLFRDGEPVREFNPGPFWFVEVTDTYSGEANYSWVTRVKVRANSEAHALRRFAKDAGFSGRLVRDSEDRWNVRGMCVCFFLSAWDDDYHGSMFHVKEL